MPATNDIIATYRGPGRVMRRLLSEGPREDRALIFLMMGCLMMFVGQTPRLAREAFETDADLGMLMGATLMAWIFIAPLLIYGLAAVSYLLAKVMGSPISPYGARMALFWALLAASPIILLWGLTAGFIGPGVELSLVGGIWLALFVWFYAAGFRAAAQEARG